VALQEGGAAAVAGLEVTPHRPTAKRPRSEERTGFVVKIVFISSGGEE
jgi:hypothetical protein